MCGVFSKAGRVKTSRHEFVAGSGGGDGFLKVAVEMLQTTKSLENRRIRFRHLHPRHLHPGQVCTERSAVQVYALNQEPSPKGPGTAQGPLNHLEKGWATGL